MSVKRPLISLCIPTNGVSEWVFPLLDSIYGQGMGEDLFEVIVTDNGHNRAFGAAMQKYTETCNNLVYSKTDAYEFLSEPETYKKAKGVFIKFVNHRSRLHEGSLQYYIDFVRKYEKLRPVVYFTNGELGKKKEFRYRKFSDFVKALSYWSSCSSGMGFWKDDFDRVPAEAGFNVLFPHTDILFHRRNAGCYIINNRKLMDEVAQGRKPKGKYNLFYAFAVEYPSVLCGLMRDGDLGEEDFLYLKKQNLQFISRLYRDYMILHRYCSYDLSGCRDSLDVFYSSGIVRLQAYVQLVKAVFSKLL